MLEVKAGHRPRRTLLFATWDAEEWGLIGSTEYVEDDTLRLMRGGVAYLNQDGSASGSTVGGGGSPSLRPMLRDVMAHVADPSGAGTVYQVWRKQTKIADSLQPPMGSPGGGSDFAGFYNHLGIPMADWGFGGGGGVYHSMYDSYHWMSKFGDTSYAYHATAAKIGAAMTLRIANAEILPYDYVEFAKTMRGYLPALDSALVKKGWPRGRFGAERRDRSHGDRGEVVRAGARRAPGEGDRHRAPWPPAPTRRCCSWSERSRVRRDSSCARGSGT